VAVRVLGMEGASVLGIRLSDSENDGRTQAAFRDSVDDYLAWCAELGQEPERAYAGRFLVRMAPGLHRDLALAAERTGVGINAFVVACVEREVGGGDAGGAQGPNSAAGTTAMPSRRR